MRSQMLYCEVCGKHTQHDVDDENEDGPLGVCTQCGRLHFLPTEPSRSARDRPSGSRCDCDR